MKAPSLDIGILRAGYLARRHTPADIMQEVLRRTSSYGDKAVWISRPSDEAVMAEARALGEKDPGKLPLYGIPFAAKDNIDVGGQPTTAGCPAFAYTPSHDATVIRRLKEAGAILIGKTNLDQFATGLVGTRSPHGAPRCVFDERYISGGSSSGSAVAVAAGFVSFALGTDTAGSGRVPAAFNNIVGLKPTRGLISNFGVVPACRSLDCVSVFAGCTADALAVLSIAQGADANDSYTRESGPRVLPSDRFRFGVLGADARSFFGNKDYERLYADAIERQEALGGTPVPINYGLFDDVARLLYDGPWVAERLAAIQEFAHEHEGDMDPTVRKIILGADDLSAVDAFNGQYRLQDLLRETEKEWEKMDFLFLPTAPTHYTVEKVNADPIGTNKALGTYTNFVNLLDCAAIAIPAGFGENGLPFGVSLIGPAFTDVSLAVIADALHHSLALGIGAERGASVPRLGKVQSDQQPRINLFVVGAHLSGMPLNHELQSLGARLEREVRTAPDYRFYVLSNTDPAKPALVHVPDYFGRGIEGEVWSLTPEGFGRFVAAIPAPLGIGKVMLEDGSSVPGFLCEAYGVEGAREITQHGGWRAYLAEV